MVSDVGLLQPMADVEDKAAEWSKYWQNFGWYSKVMKLEPQDDATMIAHLMMHIGQVGLDAYRSFEQDLSAKEKDDFNVLITKFNEYFLPQKNTIFERWKFLSCKQREVQTYQDFFTELKIKLRTCDYGDRKDEFLRDKIVLSIKDKKIMQELLLMKDLTSEKAIAVCRSAELVQDQVSKIILEDKYLSVDKVRPGGKPPDIWSWTQET